MSSVFTLVVVLTITVFEGLLRILFLPHPIAKGDQRDYYYYYLLNCDELLFDGVKRRAALPTDPIFLILRERETALATLETTTTAYTYLRSV